MKFFTQRQRIAIVPLEGEIDKDASDGINLDNHGDAIESAFDWVRNPTTDVVLFSIDSPGGSPVQSQAIGDLILELSEKKGIQTVAVGDEIVASGGYWIACACDQIVSSPMSIVGSIGVISGGFGFSELIARYGVERRIYTSGESKSKLDPFKPENPKDLEWLTELLTDTHADFTEWVQTRREGSLKPDLLKEGESFFDGSVWHAKRAAEIGIIDGVASLRDVVTSIDKDETADIRWFERKRGLLERVGLSPRAAMTTALSVLTKNRIRM